MFVQNSEIIKKTSLDTILVINCGSSSVKFSLIQLSTAQTLLSGLAERLLTPEACITIKQALLPEKNEPEKNEPEKKESKKQKFIVKKKRLIASFDHQEALTVLVSSLQQLNLVEQILAVGHRVVHGGEHYSIPTLINADVKSTIAKLAKLAPLHNPANLIGIEACLQAFSNLPQIAVFDTAFHQSMPEKAFIYGLPYHLYQKHGIRKYGFHGTSHYFVAKAAAKMVDKPLKQCNFISAHLGNGCSVCAIKKGKSVDTSLGMTPLEGVMMGTRSGDVDAGIIFHLVEQLGYSINDVEKMLNKESGLLGVSQLSNDCRTLETAMLADDSPKAKQAKLALTIFCYRVAKSIASFSASLTQLDGLIFTGGIGENSSWIREQILNQLSLLNFHICPEKNQKARFGHSGDISLSNSRDCWVIPTNEEWVIAEHSFQLIQSTKG